MNLRIDDLELDGMIAQESVIAPTLLNSWVNVGLGNAAAGFYLSKDGRVHLSGLIKSGTNTPGTTLFVLPSGYRPGATLYFPTISNALLGMVIVDTAGNVIIQAGSATDFSLSGISFRVA